MVGSVQEHINKLLPLLHDRISLALKKLLENRHLYQSETLSFEDLVDSTAHRIGVRSVEDLKKELLKRIGAEWATGWTISETSGTLQVVAPDVKLFCAKCDRLEAFNTALAQPHSLFHGLRENSQPVQVFALSYLCQACKSVPEVFLVRRVGFKLSLCGRAPIEHIDVPPCIPKPVQSFYRGGILAFQSGQALAGNFMLRTVIEQWARITTKSINAVQADKILDAYMESLPADFKARFTSVRDLYGDLSADIHGALGSSDLFERARDTIIEHFDARRVLKVGILPLTSNASG